jgi:hypothetical protein
MNRQDRQESKETIRTSQLKDFRVAHMRSIVFLSKPEFEDYRRLSAFIGG